VTEPVKPSFLLGLNILAFSIPVIADCSLFFRLVAVFPKRTTSQNRRFAVLIFPILLKFARITNGVFFAIKYHRAVLAQSDANGISIVSADSASSNNLAIVTWTLELVDNM
jgi:hypothetical protein